MANWLHRGLRELVFLLAGLVGLLLLAAGGLWWWSGSEGSLAWTLRQVARFQPLTAEGVHGSLREGLHIERLHWQQDGLDVEADDVHVEWQPLTLPRRQLRFDRVQAARVRVEDRRPPSPARPPESLEMPLRIVADQLKVGRLDWTSADSAVTVGNLAGAYSFDGARHRIQLDDLRWAGGSYQGSATLGARGELPLDAKLEGRFEAAVPGSSTRLALQFAATLQGPIADLKAQAVLNAPTAAPSAPGGTATASHPASATATATARITPWAAQPIAQAQADFRQLDLAALWPGRLPHTSLTGTASVQPAATGTWTVAADMANAMAGPWDRARLPVESLRAQGEWRTGGEGLVRSLQARLGGGELHAHGEWRGTSGWAVQSRLQSVDPSALYSAMAALPLSGSADLKGQGSAIDFVLDLKAAGGKIARAKPRRAAGEVTTAVQALELRQGSARGRWADGRLALPAFDIRTADASLRGALDLRPAARAGSGRVSLDAPGMKASAEGQLAQTSGRGNVRLDIVNAGRALNWVRRLPAIPAAWSDIDLAGRGEAQIAWQGGWRDPALQARVSLPLLEVRGPAKPDKTDTAVAPPWTFRDAMATVDGRLSDASLQLRGRAEQGRRRAGAGAGRARRPALALPRRLAGNGSQPERFGQRSRIGHRHLDGDAATSVRPARGKRQLRCRRRPGPVERAGHAQPGPIRARCAGLGAGALAPRRVADRGSIDRPAAGLAGPGGRAATGRLGTQRRHGVRRAMGRQPGCHAAPARHVGTQPGRRDGDGGNGARHVGGGARRGARCPPDVDQRRRGPDPGPEVGQRTRRHGGRPHRHSTRARRRRRVELAPERSDRRRGTGPAAAHRCVVVAGAAGLAPARFAGRRHCHCRNPGGSRGWVAPWPPTTWRCDRWSTAWSCRAAACAPGWTGSAC